MLQQHIKSYIGNQITQLSVHLEVAGLPQSTEEVHDARVCIKKIHAFDTVFDIRKKNKRIRKLFNKNLNIIFQAAGKLRDIEIQSNLIKDYEKLLDQTFSLLEGRLKKKVDKERNKLRKIIDDKQGDFLSVLQREINNEIFALSDDNIVGLIKNFLNHAIQKSEKISKLINPKSLHKQRILLKEIRFCCEMTADVTPELDTAGKISLIKEMEDILGRWHDYNILNNTVERQIEKLKKSEVEDMYKLNSLLHAIKNDIILLLDTYRKNMPNLVLEP